MGKNFHKPTVSVIGGDKRNIILTELLTDYGYDAVYVDDNEKLISSLNRQVVILPLPITRDGVTLNCKNKIKLVDIICNFHPHTRVLCGGLNKDFTDKLDNKFFDYYNVEQVLTDNAYLTAEATLKLIIENTDSAVVDTKILIIGSGKCGMALAKLLKKIDCNVNLTTRRPAYNVFAFLNNIEIKNTANLADYISEFDVIVNTAPSMVLDSETLSCVDKNALIIELATQCAGVDMDCAKQFGLNAVYAPALPGKYSPASAAKVLFKSINRIILEEFA